MTVRTINRLGPQKVGPAADQRLTTCKYCRYSVLIGEAWVWLTKPLGISHERCADRAGAL